MTRADDVRSDRNRQEQAHDRDGERHRGDDQGDARELGGTLRLAQRLGALGNRIVRLVQAGTGRATSSALTIDRPAVTGAGGVTPSRS